MTALKTAKQWEEFWIPRGLRLHTYHGFGASYPAQHCWPDGYDTNLMTDREFRNKCGMCSQTGMPKEWWPESLSSTVKPT